MTRATALSLSVHWLFVCVCVCVCWVMTTGGVAEKACAWGIKFVGCVFVWLQCERVSGQKQRLPAFLQMRSIEGSTRGGMQSWGGAADDPLLLSVTLETSFQWTRADQGCNDTDPDPDETRTDLCVANNTPFVPSLSDITRAAGIAMTAHHENVRPYKWVLYPAATVLMHRPHQRNNTQRVLSTLQTKLALVWWHHFKTISKTFKLNNQSFG